MKRMIVVLAVIAILVTPILSFGANTFKSSIMILDTFTGINAQTGAAGLYNSNGFVITSIEWQKPTTVGHTATVTNGEGDPIFDEECVTVKQSIIKYYPLGMKVSNILIGNGAVSSGKILITIKEGL